MNQVFNLLESDPADMHENAYILGKIKLQLEIYLCHHWIDSPVHVYTEVDLSMLIVALRW